MNRNLVEEGSHVTAIGDWVDTDRPARLQREPSMDSVCVDNMIAFVFAHYKLEVDGDW